MCRSDKAAVAARVARMFLRYPSSRGLDVEATVAAYATDLCQFPLWAVDAAIKEVIRGYVGSAGQFAPSSIEIQAACKKHILKPAMELRDIGTILNANVYRERTPEEKRRVCEMFNSLKSDLGFNRPFETVSKPGVDMSRREAEISLETLAERLPPVTAISTEAFATLSKRRSA